jgi:hypothetical protein
VSSDLWDDAPEDGVGDTLTPKRLQFLKDCESNPLLYFWGTDPETGHPIVRTRDTHDAINPIKPLPQWPYLFFVLARWVAGLDRVMLVAGLIAKHIVDKPRQLMVSWLALIWLDYNCLFKPYRTCLVNKATQDEAEKMLFGRLGTEKGVHKFWPKWFADWAQVREKVTTGELIYGRTGSVIQATGENVDDRAARGDQASIFFVDEAARCPRLHEIVAALVPMSQQVILVSTPELGSPGAAFFAEILAEGASK